MSVVSTRTRVLTAPRAAALSWPRCLLAALPAWVLARVIVLAVFALAADRHGAQSLEIWDAAWYRDLGVHGYEPYGEAGSRFFPLLPAIVSVGHTVGLPAPAWLLAVCWVAALLFAAALYRLTLLETGDDAAARRAAWLIQLVPGANVLAVGYTEAVAGLLAVLYFIALRHRGFGRGGFLVGALGGLARPTGLLLAVGGAAQTVRAALRSRADRARGVPVRWTHLVALTLAPLAGAAAYLLWAYVAFGDPLTPYRVQASADLRGGVFMAPWEYLDEDSSGGYPWRLLLVLLAVAAVALLLCLWRLPFPYALWSLPMLGLAVTAWGLHSVPRYLAAVFPLWMAVAIVCRYRWAWGVLLTASSVGFAWVAYLNLIPAGPVP